MSATTEAPKPAKARSNLTIAALLAAMAPVVAGIYQQSEDARQQQAQRRHELQQRQELETRKEEEADVASASALQAQLAEPRIEVGQFCNRVFFAASQLSAQPVATRTRSVLFAALRMRDADGRRLLVCQCGAGESGNASWLADLQPMITPDTAGGLDRLTLAVREAVGSCELAGPAARISPAPVAPVSSKKSGESHPDDTVPMPMPMPMPMPRAAPPPVLPGGTVASAPVPPAAPPCRIASPGDARRIRVFIQIPDASVREQAQRFRDALNAQAPYAAAPIQVMGAARSPRQPQVRYSYSMDQAAAERVSDALAACTGLAPLRPPVLLRGMGTRVDTGVLEVWWPTSALPVSTAP